MALAAPSNTDHSTYWRDLSEKDLLELEFTTTDPERIPGMSDAPPPPGPVIIEFKYDVSGRQSKARCVHCKFDNHFRGFVIRVADGTRRLVGKDCGRKLYGGLFEQAHQDFKSALSLATALKRRQRLLQAEALLTDGLSNLLCHRSSRQYSGVAWQIWRVLGDETIAALSTIAKRGGNLTVPKRIRDFAAEEREVLAPEHANALDKLNRTEQKRYRRRHNLPDAERYIWIDQSVGQLKGTAIFESREMGDRLEHLQREVINCFGALRQKTKWNETSLSLASKQLSDLIANIERQVAKLRAPIDFFEQAHLSALCEWDEHRPDGIGLGCGDGWIGRPNQYGEMDRAKYPPQYEMPPIEFIKSFRIAVDQNR